MYRLFKSQLKNIFLTKSYKIMMFIIWGCIVCVYIMNVKDYYGYELSQMQSYVEISSISSGRYALTRIIAIVFPFVSIIPAGFSLFGDIKTGRETYWIYRVGRKKYYMTKAVAVFVSTFICFFIPLLFENIINYITFPANVHGNRYFCSLYSREYKTIVKYMFFNIYFKHPFIYQLIMIIIFSGIAAMLGFVTAASSCIINKFAAFLFLPCYLLIQIIDGMNIYGKFSDYIETCSAVVNVYKFIKFGIVWSGIIFVASGLLFLKARRDTL